MRFSVVLLSLGVNAYYGVDQTPTEYQLGRFWTESRSFEGHNYGNDTTNPCTHDDMKNEEPWKTVCTTPHKLCNYVDVEGDDDGVKKWSTYYTSVHAASGETYGYSFGASAMNAFDANLSPFYNNEYGNNEGDVPPGYSFNPMPSFTVTMRGDNERQIFYQCKQYQTAIQSLYGASYTKYKNLRHSKDTDTCDATSCHRDHAVMMIDTVSSKRYWVSTHGGTVTCSGNRFDETNDGFSPLIRDHPASKWADIKENVDGDFWGNYAPTQPVGGHSEAGQAGQNPMPYHSGHPNSDKMAAYSESIFQKDHCSAHQLYSVEDYIRPSKEMHKYWDEHMKVYPSRIIVEDAENNLYTWLKIHSYDGPFTSAYDTDTAHETTCGTGELTGWGDWLSKYSIREHQTANEECLMKVGCYPHNNWRMNTAVHTTWKWTDQQVADISRCHGNVMIPEDKPVNEWTKRACPDARGCISAKFSFNPCIYDFRPGQLADTDGPVDLEKSNITWPRGGTWDSATKTMTFNDDPGTVEKKFFPIDSVTLNADGGTEFNQEFNCTAEGGWFGGDGHKVGWFGPEPNDRKTGGQLNNPGRKRRAPIERCAAESECTSGYAWKKRLYFKGNFMDVMEDKGDFMIWASMKYSNMFMDATFPDYFTTMTDDDPPVSMYLPGPMGKWGVLTWMKWGAWNFLDGLTDGGPVASGDGEPLEVRLQNGHQGLFIGISNIISYEDSWDIRYPICKGAQCPDSCDVGTTADVTILCTNEFNLNRWDADADERGLVDGVAAEAYITVTAGAENNPGTSCSFDIDIEVDCEPYIVLFSRNPGEDFDEEWNGNPQLLTDPEVLVDNYEKRVAAGGPTDKPPPPPTVPPTVPPTEPPTEPPTKPATKPAIKPAGGSATRVIASFMVLLCMLF